MYIEIVGTEEDHVIVLQWELFSIQPETRFFLFVLLKVWNRATIFLLGQYYLLENIV